MQDSNQDSEMHEQPSSSEDSAPNQDVSWCRGDQREFDEVSSVEFHPGTFPRASPSQLTQRRVVRARRRRMNSNSSPIANPTAAFAAFFSTAPRAMQGQDNSNSDNSDDDDGDDEPMPPLLDLSNNQNNQQRQENDQEEDEVEESGNDDEDSSNEDDSDEEEDDGECTCGACMFLNLTHSIANSHVNHHSDDGNDESHDNEGYNDNDNEDRMCCICFDNDNPIVTLECCGSNNREATTSTRFCTNCIFKCLASQSNLSPGSMEMFCGRVVGECPRCRSLVCVRGGIITPMFLPPYLVKKATFQEAVEHASRKEEMRNLLYSCAFCYPKFIPIELLEDNLERARQLVRWGILQQVCENEMYSMDPYSQSVLRETVKYQVMDNNNDDNEDLVLASPFLLPLPWKLMQAAWLAVTKFKLIKSMRLLNQSVTVFFVCIGGLPDIPEKPLWQGTIVACLNLLLVTLAFQVILLAIFYLIFVYLSVKTVGSLIKTTHNAGWAIWFRHLAVAGLATLGFIGDVNGRPYLMAAIIWGTSSSWILPKHANMMPDWMSCCCWYCGSFILLLKSALLMYRYFLWGGYVKDNSDDIMVAEEPLIEFS